MATSDWNSIDEFKESFPECDCAFLDILGYKQRAEDYFENRFNLLGRIERAFHVASVAQHLTSLLVDSSDVSVEVVSDSIVVLQPSRSGGLGVMLPFTCHFASLLSFEGLFLRGGISRGRHCRRQTAQGFDFLASEALQRAYLLESEEAVVHRILVDKRLVGSLSPDERELIILEGDDFIVDFAHHVINRDGGNFNEVQAEMTELHERLEAETSKRVVDKIQWLLDYYHWSIESNPNWDVFEFISYGSGLDRGFRRLDR